MAHYYNLKHGEFRLETCCNCGVAFMMPEALYAACSADHKKWFYCPNGHGQHYIGETDAERNRRRAERAEQQKARLEDALREKEREKREAVAAADRRTAAAKGQLTKHKKRSAAGTCPCCNRTFKQLASHMANKHPEYVADTKAA